MKEHRKKQSKSKTNPKKEKQEKNLPAIVEAFLFTAGDSVDEKKIQAFLRLTKRQWRDIIDSLTKKYEEKNSGLQIIHKGSKIQLVTKPSLAELVAKFLGKTLGNEELSRATLETLAVVAYRGPVTRAQVEYVRGVNCSFALRTLSLRGIIDRKDNPLDSRSYLYEISFDFLKNLGLKSVEELKDYDKLKERLEVEEGSIKN